MIDYIELRSFLQQGEDVYKEFKPKITGHTEEIGRAICAFANDFNWIGGGFLFVGVNNDGLPCNTVENYDEFQRRIADICRDSISPPLTPVIKRHSIDEKPVYEIKIVRSMDRPHRYKGACYIRVTSTTRRATLDEENQIRDSCLIPSFDHQPVEKSSPSDLDFKKFRDFLRDTRPQEIFDIDDDLINIAKNLDFASAYGDRILLKTGTILLFGSNPNKFFPHSKIQAIKFNGLSLSSPIASKQIIEGTLPELIIRTRQFIESYVATAGVFLPDQYDRIDYNEYPYWAIREAIANAVVHREYQQYGREIDIRIFDDRIEIISPGTLGGGLTVEDLGTGKRYIRNHLIADALRELKFIEKAGTGIYRLREEMIRNGSPEPVFKVDSNTFTVILPAHPYYSSQRFLEEANQEKGRANYSAARELYQESLNKNPKNYYALVGLGDMERDLGNQEIARELYKKAIDLDPSNPQAWLSYCILEEKRGNIEWARNMYREASKKVPKNSVISRSWAILEWRNRQYKEADRLFEQAIRGDPSDPITWYKRGQMNINSKIERIKRQGEEQLKKALSLAQNEYVESDIYFLLARAMPSLKYSAEEVKDAYEKSLSLNPYRGATHYFYGLFLKNIGENEKAEDHLNKAKRFGFIPRKRHKPLSSTNRKHN